MGITVKPYAGNLPAHTAANAVRGPCTFDSTINENPRDMVSLSLLAVGSFFVLFFRYAATENRLPESSPAARVVLH